MARAGQPLGAVGTGSGASAPWAAAGVGSATHRWLSDANQTVVTCYPADCYKDTECAKQEFCILHRAEEALSKEFDKMGDMITDQIQDDVTRRACLSTGIGLAVGVLLGLLAVTYIRVGRDDCKGCYKSTRFRSWQATLTMAALLIASWVLTGVFVHVAQSAMADMSEKLTNGLLGSGFKQLVLGFFKTSPALESGGSEATWQMDLENPTNAALQLNGFKGICSINELFVSEFNLAAGAVIEPKSTARLNFFFKKYKVTGAIALSTFAVKQQRYHLISFDVAGTGRYGDSKFKFSSIFNLPIKFPPDVTGLAALTEASSGNGVILTYVLEGLKLYHKEDKTAFSWEDTVISSPEVDLMNILMPILGVVWCISWFMLAFFIYAVFADRCERHGKQKRREERKEADAAIAAWEAKQAAKGPGAIPGATQPFGYAQIPYAAQQPYMAQQQVVGAAAPQLYGQQGFPQQQPMPMPVPMPAPHCQQYMVASYNGMQAVPPAASQYAMPMPPLQVATPYGVSSRHKE